MLSVSAPDNAGKDGTSEVPSTSKAAATAAAEAWEGDTAEAARPAARAAVADDKSEALTSVPSPESPPVATNVVDAVAAATAEAASFFRDVFVLVFSDCEATGFVPSPASACLRFLALPSLPAAESVNALCEGALTAQQNSNKSQVDVDRNECYASPDQFCPPTRGAYVLTAPPVENDDVGSHELCESGSPRHFTKCTVSPCSFTFVSRIASTTYDSVSIAGSYTI